MGYNFRNYPTLEQCYQPHFRKEGIKQDAFFSGVVGLISLALSRNMGAAAGTAVFTYALNAGVVPSIQYAYYRWVK